MEKLALRDAVLVALILLGYFFAMFCGVVCLVVIRYCRED